MPHGTNNYWLKEAQETAIEETGPVFAERKPLIAERTPGFHCADWRRLTVCHGTFPFVLLLAVHESWKVHPSNRRALCKRCHDTQTGCEDSLSVYRY